MNKRLIVRLSVVAGVVALGLIAIFSSQRGGDNVEEPLVAESPADAVAEAAQGEPAVAETAPEPEVQTVGYASPEASAEAATDPFRSGRLTGGAAASEPRRWEEPAEARPMSDMASGPDQQVNHEASEAEAQQAAADPAAASESNYQAAATGDPFASRRAVPAPSQASEPAQGVPYGEAEASMPGDAAYAAETQPATEVSPSSEPSKTDGAPGFRGGFPSTSRRSAEATSSQLPHDTAPDAEPAAEAAPPRRSSSEWPPQNPTRRPARIEMTEPATLPGESLESQRLPPRSQPITQPDPASMLPVQEQADATSAMPRTMQAAVGGAGEGRPGPRNLEGIQQPQLSIQKLAPAEIQVGKPAVFEVKVQNLGAATAQGVEVHDAIPAGTQLVSTTPEAAQAADGSLVWTLGDIQSGEEATVQMELMPMEEGEVGSVASVVMRAEASARSVVTKAELALRLTAARQVLIGQNLQLTIAVANNGTGAATGVVLHEQVPEGLSHSSGSELEFEVGQLAPGETRQLELTLSAVQAGRFLNRLVARAEAGIEITEQVEIEVIAPALEVAVEGPSRRYLERQATYMVSVSNPGTAPARDVELVTHLPKGMKFVKANNAGHYDATQHKVTWSLEELPAAESGTVELVALPIEAGEQKFRTEGRAQQGLSDEQEQTVMVEGLAAIYFEVVDVEDPVEVGGETVYEIRVINQGSKACTNVRVAAELPPEMKPVEADGPSQHQVQGQIVAFQPLPVLAPKADTVFQVRVQGLAAGHHRVSVQVACDEIPEPVTKEESTRIYADE